MKGTAGAQLRRRRPHAQQGSGEASLWAVRGLYAGRAGRVLRALIK